MMKKYIIFCMMIVLLASFANAEDMAIKFDGNPIGTPLDLQTGGMMVVVTDVAGGVYVKEVRATSEAAIIENHIERYIGLVGEKRKNESKTTTKDIRLPTDLPNGDFDVNVMIVYDDAQDVERILTYDMEVSVEGGSGLLGWIAKNVPKDVYYAVKNHFDPIIIPRENPEMTPADLINAGLDEIGLTNADIRTGKYGMELIKDVAPVEMTTTVEEAIHAVGKDKLSVERMEGDYDITIIKSAKVYKITNTATDESVIRAKVLLTVTSPGGVYDVETMEVIPKSMSDNVGNMGFAEVPVIIEADPIVKWNFDYVPEDQAKDYAYVSEKDIDAVDSTTHSTGFKIGAFAKFIVFLIKGGWILFLAAIIAVIVYLTKFKGGKEGQAKKKAAKKEKKVAKKTKKVKKKK